MPDSTRITLIKKMESSLLHIETATMNLGHLYETYYPNYPEHYEPLQSCIVALCQMVELLRTFREDM
jgi:hypothetical protein